MSNNSANQKPIELKDVYEVLVEIKAVLKESSKWTKFAGIKEIKPVLEEQLPNDSKKLIYHLSDGTHGTQKISKIVGAISHQSVLNYWKNWEKIGLGEYISVRGGSRFKHSFDLTDFAIKIPEIPKQAITSTTELEKPTESSTMETENK